MINDDCTAGCFWSAAPKETHSDIKRGGVEEEEEEEEEKGKTEFAKQCKTLRRKMSGWVGGADLVW